MDTPHFEQEKVARDTRKKIDETANSVASFTSSATQSVRDKAARHQEVLNVAGPSLPAESREQAERVQKLQNVGASFAADAVGAVEDARRRAVAETEKIEKDVVAHSPGVVGALVGDAKAALSALGIGGAHLITKGNKPNTLTTAEGDMHQESSAKQPELVEQPQHPEQHGVAHAGGITAAVKDTLATLAGRVGRRTGPHDANVVNKLGDTKERVQDSLVDAARHFLGKPSPDDIHAGPTLGQSVAATASGASEAGKQGAQEMIAEAREKGHEARRTVQSVTGQAAHFPEKYGGDKQYQVPALQVNQKAKDFVEEAKDVAARAAESATSRVGASSPTSQSGSHPFAAEMVAEAFDIADNFGGHEVGSGVLREHMGKMEMKKD